jgi:hypothetical protein
MKCEPKVVNSIDWDIILKCKSGKYASKEECMKSIWTEEYGNSIEYYNVNNMIHIIGQVIEEVVPIKQRAHLLDKLLRADFIDTKEKLLNELYVYLQLLQVRDRDIISGCYDLYIIKHDGKYYTVSQYDMLKEENNIDKEVS